MASYLVQKKVTPLVSTQPSLPPEAGSIPIPESASIITKINKAISETKPSVKPSVKPVKKVDRCGCW